MHPSIDDEKRDPRRAGWVKYVLRRAVVYQSPSGSCFTDYLDDLDAIAPDVDERALSDPHRAYIAGELSSNRARAERQAGIVLARLPRPGARVLDVGCGGGLMLSLLAEGGAEVEGLELQDARILYARQVHGLRVHKRGLDDPGFVRERSGAYDAVTLFDVIEHVNFPARTLAAARALLSPGGHLFVETPCRDGALHRIGDAGYRLSRGRYPTLLNLMYSNHPFGHKQIFTRAELARLIAHAGLAERESRLFHDLALPYENYLRKLLPDRRAAALLAPAARAFFAALPLRNKLLAIAQAP